MQIIALPYLLNLITRRQHQPQQHKHQQQRQQSQPQPQPQQQKLMIHSYHNGLVAC